MTDDRTGADETTGTGAPGADQGKAAELACPACGAVVFAEEIFCEECGHRLADGPPAEAAGRDGATIRQESAPSAPRTGGPGPCPGCGGTAIDADGYCETCGLRQPAERDHVEIELPAGPGGNGTRPVVAAGASDRGRRYSRNEDALALAAHLSGIAAVVSDGVGSSQRPDEASRAAADTGLAELVARLDAGEDAEDATRHAALRAAAAVAGLATSPSDAPSCTYVSAVTRGPAVTVGWIGDSRAYWLAADGSAGPGEDAGPGPAPDEVDGAEVSTGDMAELGASRRLTEDDSWAAFMVAEGSLTEAEAEAHPNAHVITAWLGADAGQVSPHVATFRPDGPGTLLVCSDGLWNYFPAAADLAALLAGGEGSPGPAADPLGAARTLVRQALEAGGRDNITVAVIPVPSPGGSGGRVQESIPQSTQEPR
ncbi:protein phosphatase 2C domain-containing protein [Actinomadura luteofluorescens]|uniref:PP2C family serine/threonine-protein phosphatase n=1 Tax=Actinomadura luteofluorescens TaxID=46163 RepID=UPI0021643EAC|nr:protein phosphatase 2C domain-containing protein [Actinomadura glauciflava]MCR3737599.1 Serine/threonine protein phosphatase PrpC [Actinomadura glauciflava]